MEYKNLNYLVVLALYFEISSGKYITFDLRNYNLI